jgi:NAD(P) transhydrogenase subunit alpha
VGEIVTVHGVKIIGHKNAAGRLAADASALYSRNLFNLINAFWDKDAKTLAFPADDEIVVGIKLTEGGAVVHERLRAG